MPVILPGINASPATVFRIAAAGRIDRVSFEYIESRPMYAILRRAVGSNHALTWNGVGLVPFSLADWLQYVIPADRPLSGNVYTIAIPPSLPINSTYLLEIYTQAGEMPDREADLDGHYEHYFEVLTPAQQAFSNRSVSIQDKIIR